MNRPLRVLGLLALLSAARPADALLWPDVPERIERDLGSKDPVARRMAARQLVELGPARGAPLVLRALADVDTDVRLVAAQSAARLRVPLALDAVLPWLGDRDAHLRVAACEVARALPDAQKAVPQLARALSDGDATVRSAAADALGAQVSPEAVAPLLGKLDDTSPAVRVQIARALARLGDSRAVVPLAGKVQDTAPEVRQAVARALGDLGDARATPSLILALRDASADVRVEALGALGHLRAAEATAAISPLAADRFAPVRMAALAALGRIRTPAAARALVALLGQGEDAKGGLERTPVRDAVVACGAVAIGELTQVLERPTTDAVATSAAWVLGEMRAREAEGTLIRAMRRGTLAPPAALHALAGAGTSAAVPVVLEYASDPSPVIRDEAFGAAAALLDPSQPDGRAVEPLSAALRDARLSVAERAKVAMLLGRTGAPRAAQLLSGLTSAKEPSLRLAAIDALGVLGPAGADDALVECLNDPDAQVRLRAAVALADAGGPSAVTRLLGYLDGHGEVDRATVLTALGGALARVRSDAAVTKLSSALDLAAGPERDAILEALGRAAGAIGFAALERASRGDTDDRRTVATLLALSGAPATRLAAALLADPDASVRAQAAWALGYVGDKDKAPLLASALASRDADVATNAAAALGRLAERVHDPSLAVRALCPAASDVRPLVRANALAGLSLSGARCADGAVERRALESDPDDAVRRSAARLVAKKPRGPEDARVLERCRTADRSGAVARACRPASAGRGTWRTVTVYPIAEGFTTPSPHAAFAILLADGTVHVGTADRRGAAVEPQAPQGDLALVRTQN